MVAYATHRWIVSRRPYQSLTSTTLGRLCGVSAGKAGTRSTLVSGSATVLRSTLVSPSATVSGTAGLPATRRHRSPIASMSRPEGDDQGYRARHPTTNRVNGQSVPDRAPNQDTE